MSMPPIESPICSTTPGSICRDRGGLSHLQETSTQGNVALDIAPIVDKRISGRPPQSIGTACHLEGLAATTLVVVKRTGAGVFLSKELLTQCFRDVRDTLFVCDIEEH